MKKIRDGAKIQQMKLIKQLKKINKIKNSS